jgi:hypothetical protein
MVFSTVQISMPGTSCAPALPDISTPGNSDIDATQTIRPIIGVLIDCAKMPETAKPRFPRRVNGPARNAEENILQPYSRVEIWQRKVPHAAVIP